MLGGVARVAGDGHAGGVLVRRHLVRVRLHRRRHLVHGRAAAGQLRISLLFLMYR